MGVRDAVIAYNGVANWLNNQENIDIGKPKRKTCRAQEEYLNNILIQFGKDNNIKMERNNSPSYKGSYSPVMSNCIRVQENFKLFREWIINNYSKG